jgi:hypothetical protein
MNKLIRNYGSRETKENLIAWGFHRNIGEQVPNDQN